MVNLEHTSPRLAHARAGIRLASEKGVSDIREIKSFKRLTLNASSCVVVWGPLNMIALQTMWNTSAMYSSIVVIGSVLPVIRLFIEANEIGCLINWSYSWIAMSFKNIPEDELPATWS